MKSDVMASVIQMDDAALKNLLTEVKETVAKEIYLMPQTKKQLVAADLWNIQRKLQPAASRIRFIIK
jgi:hypothetical protein